jgi:putative DNA primase/helicase
MDREDEREEGKIPVVSEKFEQDIDNAMEAERFNLRVEEAKRKELEIREDPNSTEEEKMWAKENTKEAQFDPEESRQNSPLEGEFEFKDANSVEAILTREEEEAINKDIQNWKASKRPLKDMLGKDEEKEREPGQVVAPKENSNSTLNLTPSPTAIPQSVTDTYNEHEGKFYLKNKPDTLAFIDKGTKLKAKLSNKKIAASMVDIAEERSWTEIKVNGTKEFRRSVWLEASTRGLTVQGFSPKAADLAELKQLTSSRDVNSIEPEHQNSQSKNATALKTKEQETGENLYSGKLVEHGKAPYLNKKENNPSYYATVEKEDGKRNTAWGVDIQRAIKESDTEIGDKVELESKGKTPVTITKQIKDKEGNITGSKSIETHRNAWDIKAERIRDIEQKPEKIAKDHPDLVNEVVAIKIAEKFSQKQFSNPKDQARFVEQVRGNLAQKVENSEQTKIAIKERTREENTLEEENDAR